MFFGGGGGGPTDLHPFVVGLLQTLPKPESDWPVEQRVRWLQTASGIFDLIYKGNSGAAITIDVSSTEQRQLS